MGDLTIEPNAIFFFSKQNKNRTHPSLRPYHELKPEDKEIEKNAAYIVIGSLLDWGYAIQKAAVTADD